MALASGFPCELQRLLGSELFSWTALPPTSDLAVHWGIRLKGLELIMLDAIHLAMNMVDYCSLCFKLNSVGSANSAGMMLTC